MPRHSPAGTDVTTPGAAGSHLEHPRDRRCVRRVATSFEPPPDGAAGERERCTPEAPARRSDRCRPPAVRAACRRRAAGQRCGRGPRRRRAGPPRPATAGSRGAPGCGGTEDRQLVASCTYRRSSASHRATVSARRRARIGLVGPGVIALSPLAPEPRISASNSVSAWSSAVWPVRASGPSATWRATRARASRFGPSASATRSSRNAMPNRSVVPRAHSASAADDGRSP